MTVELDISVAFEIFFKMLWYQLVVSHNNWLNYYWLDATFLEEGIYVLMLKENHVDSIRVVQKQYIDPECCDNERSRVCVDGMPPQQ